MRSRRNPPWVLVVGSVIIGLGGCDGGGSAPPVSGSAEEATVSGTVKANGNPVTSGNVVFDPANINRKVAKIVKAPLDKDGKYSATTLVGENQVMVQSPEFKTKELQYNQMSYDVPSGGATLDITLPKK